MFTVVGVRELWFAAVLGPCFICFHVSGLFSYVFLKLYAINDVFFILRGPWKFKSGDTCKFPVLDKSQRVWNIVIFWWPLQLHALKRLKRSCSRYFYVVILKISVEVCQGCPINLEKSSEATSNSGSSPGKVTNLRTKDARVESQTLEDCFVFEGGWLQFLKLPNLW